MGGGNKTSYDNGKMNYQVSIVKQDRTFHEFTFVRDNIPMEGEYPWWIDYRGTCTSLLSESQLNYWWDLVDDFLAQEDISQEDFRCVWCIVVDGQKWGCYNILPFGIEVLFESPPPVLPPPPPPPV